MVPVRLLFSMGTGTKAASSTARRRAMANTCLLTGATTMERGSMTCSMDKEHSLTWMAQFAQECGPKINSRLESGKFL